MLRGTAKRLSTSMISAVNNRRLMRFMCFKEVLNTSLFISFLGRLTKDAPGKLFLVVDNLRVHRSAMVRRWVERHRDAIELCFPPAYTNRRVR